MGTHGTRICIKRKNLTMVIFFIFVHKNVYRIRFQKIKIGPLKGFEKKGIFLTFSHEKTTFQWSKITFSSLSVRALPVPETKI